MLKSFTVSFMMLAMMSHYSPFALPISPGKEDPADKFWSWFRQNESRLRHFQSNPDKYLQEVLVEIRKVRPGLVIELEPPKNGVINMTVSADGNKDLFPIVQTLVRKAPHIDGWKIIAFRQRASLSKLRTMILKTDSFELDPNKMKFYPFIEDDSLDIVVYTTDVTANNYEDIGYAGLLLIDNILGEYDCVMKVRSYDFHDMPAFKEERDSLKPLLGLANYVDRYYSAKTLKKH